MAKDEGSPDERTITVPLRRLMTGVPRTKRAPAAIPQVKRYVLRHITPEWRDAIWDEDRGVHRVWIDDFLNQTIWSRGRGHVGGPREWIPGTDGGRARLAQRTSARYGSVLKVKVLFVEEPEGGGDPRIEVTLYGHEGKEKEEEEEKGAAEGEEEAGEGDEAEPAVPAAAPSSAAKKPASTSAAAKGDKAAVPKADAKKAAAKPKKEGGD